MLCSHGHNHLRKTSTSNPAGSSATFPSKKPPGWPTASGILAFYTPTKIRAAPITFYEQKGDAPNITSPLAVTGRVGTPFAYQIEAENNPESFALFDALPPGLSFNPATGEISGTPTLVGTRTVTIRVTNVSGVDSELLRISIEAAFTPAPEITSAQNAFGRVGTPFSYAIEASNNPDRFEITGILAAGLNFSPATGLISGTPTTAAEGTRSHLVRAINAGGSGSKTIFIAISPAQIPRPVITSSASATGRVGTPFFYQTTATNNPESFGWTGALPPGLSFDTDTGVISGTPIAEVTRTITLRATNGGGVGTRSLIITIDGALPPAPEIDSSLSTRGQVGVPFSYEISASNNPDRFAVIGSTGIVSGRPTTAGQYRVVLRGQNGRGSTTHSVTFHVVPATAPTAFLPNANFFFDTPYTPTYWSGGYSGNALFGVREGKLFLGGGYGNNPGHAQTAFTINLKNRENVVLSFRHTNLGDDPTPAMTNGRSHSGDGIFLFVDDGDAILLRDLAPFNGVNQYITVNLSTIAEREKITLGENCRILISVTTQSPSPNRGRTIDNVNITASNPAFNDTANAPGAASLTHTIPTSETAPRRGENVLMIAAVDGQIDFVMPPGYDAILATGFGADAVVTDLTTAGQPLDLQVPLLESDSGHAAYFSVPTGHRIHIH